MIPEAPVSDPMAEAWPGTLESSLFIHSPAHFAAGVESQHWLRGVPSLDDMET